MEAFVQCYNLTGVTIGDGVTNIGENAFAGCNLTSVTIPGSVSSIAENTFFECLYLRNVTIANGVASIGDEAFGNCTPGLTSITMPGSVTNLQPYAFAGCTTLASIYFTGNAPSADFTAFLQDSRAKVYYLPGMTGWSNSFADLPATMLQAYTYVINAGAVTITGFSQPGSAFIPNVSIPDTINGLPVTSITNDAFELDEGLTSITLPATITNIGQAAFADCTNLISVTISNGVKSIGANVFQSCLSLSNLIIPASVTSIGAFAFAGCVSLSSLTIPTGVTSIGPLAFEACLSLSSITIPASVTNIGVGPFYACTNLTAITVDPNNAFYSSVNGVLFDKRQGILVAYPPGLGGSYTVPCSVTNLAQFAFAHCFSLTNLYFKVNAPSIGSSVLLGDTNTMVYYLPGTLGWSSPFAGVPAVLWNPVIQTGDGSFGVSSGQFGFNIAGTANIPIAVEACTNLACPVWTPLQSLALTNGLVYFSEPAQGNGGGRFYRISSP